MPWISSSPHNLRAARRDSVASVSETSWRPDNLWQTVNQIRRISNPACALFVIWKYAKSTQGDARPTLAGQAGQIS